MPDQPKTPADGAIAFGPFRLFPARELLLEDDKPLRLGSRALEILKVLVENPGTLLNKEDLVARVWPGTFVEEGNLRVHMAALRRVLSDGQDGNRYIATVPGRGYRFVAQVSRVAGPQPAASQPFVADDPAYNLPISLTRMFGRSEIVGALVAQLPERRFITLTGPGGIGKTKVALAAAEELRANYPDGIRFVDLAPITDSSLVPSALASALGLAIRSENPLPGLIAFLKNKHMLLVLDSCERVIDTAAVLAEDVFNRAPGVHILATSREPLRAQGERVQRLLPLQVPPQSARLTAAEAMAFPAIQLFVDRASYNSEELRLTDADVPVVAHICRRLDGIALAIELAAGRVDVFGLQGLAERLDDRFRVLTRGRRTALPRHQTLAATLDWSYELLPESERVALRRLSVFAGNFTLEAANAVASGAQIPMSDVSDCVANLVAKSLVTAEFGGNTVSYRLFETMAAYTRDKLVQCGELPAIARRHAEYFRDLLRRAESEWDTKSSAEWLAAYGGQIDNVRTALDWAFGSTGDPEFGIALTIAAVPLWLQLSLMEECRRHVERAIDRARSAATPDARRDMMLAAALGSVLVYTNIGPSARAAWTDALGIAENLHDTDFKLRSLWGLWVDSLNNGAFQEALALARQFHGEAAGSASPIDSLMGERMVGITLHFLGNQIDAQPHIERMLSGYVAPIRASHIVRFQFDQRVTAKAFLARCLWLRGFPEQALRVVESAVEEAQSTGHGLSLCNVLGQGACPVAYWSGDTAASEHYLQLLLSNSESNTLTLWQTWGSCFRGLMLVKSGDTAAGLKALRSVLAEVPEMRSLPRYLGLLGELAGAMGQCGEIALAFQTIDGAIERAEHREERWCLAELLRIKGELVRNEHTPESMDVAFGCFEKALDLARERSTLSWELRTAISIARLPHRGGHAASARRHLAAVYGRFTEGFETADLRAARQLLDELR